jgi:hypothetical protein
MLWVIGLGLMAGTACHHQVCAPMTAGCTAAMPAVTASASANSKPLYYTCPMHPSVKVAQPGNCPICDMTLIPAYQEREDGPTAPCGAASCVMAGNTNHP